MLGAARWTLVPALVAAWLVLPAWALAIGPQVRDNGKFFDDKTIAQANGLIKKIEERYKKDVVVDTFDTIPNDVLKKFNYSEATRTSFFHKWRDELAEQAGANGIIVLICKYQGKTHMEVAAGRETLKKDFTPHDTEKLYEVLSNGFTKDPNGRLLEGLRSVDNTLSAHRKGPAIAAPNVPPAQVPARAAPVRNAEANAGGNILGWVCIGLCVLAAIWVVKALFRALSGGGRGGYAAGPGGSAGGPGGGYAPGGGGGGGGFMSGLFGGLFGAVAGNWIYNNMFGGQSSHQSSWGQSTAYGSGQQSAPRDDAGPSDQGQGFAGAGGDVDDGGGGGDGGGASGGDVGGGGDAGGGDWGGGGGGDWSGGGGDTGGGDTGGGGGDWGGGGGGDWGGGGADVGGGGGGGDW